MENKNIKATIAVHAKYYAFRLAEGLAKRDILDKLYTLYPKFKIGNYDIPHDLIKSFGLLGALKYANSRAGQIVSDGFLTSFFDDWVAWALKVRPAEKWIFNGYNGFCEKSLIKAKKLGAVTLLERACPHIDEQEELLREENILLLNKETAVEEDVIRERMKREYALADYIIVPSRYSQKSFITRGFDTAKVIVIPLCNEKMIELRRDEKKKSSQFTVLCVGGNFYRKGIYYLLKAWRELKLPNAKLIIKGVIPEQFRPLSSDPSVEVITKHLSNNELGELYNRATVFVLPSIDDGFGMVVVEAMRAALPVIVTENVGAADIIQEGKEGFIVPMRDIVALAEKISFLYKNPDKVKEMGQKALATSKNYTPEKYVERVIEVYKKVLA